jgi:hypothetical protein
MTQKIDAGTLVSVKEFGGNILKRMVVADKGRFVVVCNQDEYVKAKSEGRYPSGVGFPRSDVTTCGKPCP